MQIKNEKSKSQCFSPVFFAIVKPQTTGKKWYTKKVNSSLFSSKYCLTKKITTENVKANYQLPKKIILPL